jgi:hypothetical protein
MRDIPACRLAGLTAEELNAKENVQIYSTDEKTGIQALEHVNEKQLMKPGQVERIDPEYERNGTTGIIASRNVVTGEIVAPFTSLPAGRYNRRVKNWIFCST